MYDRCLKASYILLGMLKTEPLKNPCNLSALWKKPLTEPKTPVK